MFMGRSWRAWKLYVAFIVPGVLVCAFISSSMHLPWWLSIAWGTGLSTVGLWISDDEGKHEQR